MRSHEQLLARATLNIWFGRLEARERRPPWVKHFFGFSVWKIGQSLAGFGVESWAIRTTYRLERKCKHNRIPDQRFKIDVIVDNRVVKSLVDRIREKLLDIDLNRQFDPVEASSALSDGHRIDVCVHQDTVVKRLHPKIEVHCRTLFDTDERVSEALCDNYVDFSFASLARSMHEIEDLDVEGVINGVRHNHPV